VAVEGHGQVAAPEAPKKKGFFGKKAPSVMAAPPKVDPFTVHIQDKLYDAWYRECLLLMSSSASDAQFSGLINFLLRDDESGINDQLATIMLEERREHPEFLSKKAEIKRIQEKRLLGSVMAALSHPFAEVRLQAIEQMQRLDLNVGSIMSQIVDELQGHNRPERRQTGLLAGMSTGNSQSQKKLWFCYTGLLESMVVLREQGGIDATSDAALAQTVVETLLENTDADVVRGAVRLLGALGVKTDKVVFGLFGKLEAGPRSALADIVQVLAGLGLPWLDITQHLHTRCAAEAEYLPACVYRSRTPISGWLITPAPLAELGCLIYLRRPKWADAGVRTWARTDPARLHDRCCTNTHQCYKSERSVAGLQDAEPRF
jgi:hypothetical protein